MRVFCRRHNRLAAERVYGGAFMQGKIDERRRHKEARDAAKQPVLVT